MGTYLLDPDFIDALCSKLNADFIDARVQRHYSELVLLDNGVVRELSSSYINGVGIRVVVGGSVGYSSTNSVERDDVAKAATRAYKIAKAVSEKSISVQLYERPTVRARAVANYSIDPESIDSSEKVELLKDMHREISTVSGIASSVLRFGYERDQRYYISSDGDSVEYEVRMIGVSAALVSHVDGAYESLRDHESKVAGWEFMKSVDWRDWASWRAKLVVESARAPRVEPGRYDVVLDNDMVGLMLHEAFGHATEGDSVLAGGSVLRGRLGQVVAGELVSIVDDGVVEGGAYVPFDDEGTPKKRTYTVRRGVLEGFLHSLVTARALGGEPTGNARVMTYRDPLLVRQTNTYMEPGDWGVEEMIRDMGRGLYVRGRGASGGEVNPLTGAFTFTSGPSYVVESGEPVRLVKGVMLTGLILETLKRVDAVGKDLVIRTSVFGGCGKSGQTVRVGDGGPHVRVREITIGGG
jgi:TldD protein